MSPFNFKYVRELVLHVLLPRTCYACHRDLPLGERAALCAACAASVEKTGTRCCRVCGKPLPDGGAHCYHCRTAKTRARSCMLIRSAVVFGPQVRALVHAFKYAGHTYLAEFLGQWLEQQWAVYPELAEAQLLVAVPLHRRKLKSRGYNQSELLARELGQKCRLPVDSHALVRVRNTPSQTGFGREGRLKNMSGAFACVDPGAVKGKIILLIDDVATTGATLEGCAQALKAAGAKKVMAYTLAREC